jgi:GT2 family glycosyltransferase
MNEALTYIVVLNWNGAEETMECLESLASVTSPFCKVLVVDNGSIDGSPETIRQAFPAVEQLCLPTNRGYAAGNNAGFRRVLELKAEFVLFLNNDTVVDAGFVRPLIETLQRNLSVGIAVPKIFYWNQPDLLWYAGGEVNLSTGLIRHVGLRQPDAPAFNRQSSTDYATGCCFAMRCRDFDALGGFDERFAMYAEDVDLSLRVRALGKSVEYVPSSTVWHKVSASLAGHPMQKLLRKSVGALRLFRKQRAWSGMALYCFLLPLRLFSSFLTHSHGKERR